MWRTLLDSQRCIGPDIGHADIVESLITSHALSGSLTMRERRILTAREGGHRAAVDALLRGKCMGCLRCGSLDTMKAGVQDRCTRWWLVRVRTVVCLVTFAGDALAALGRGYETLARSGPQELLMLQRAWSPRQSLPPCTTMKRE